MILAIVDTGPLYTAADSADPRHLEVVELLRRRQLELVLPALVVAEATYLVGQRLGSSVEANFLRGLGQLEVEAPTRADLERMAELVERYSDFPLGGIDASVVALAERLDTRVIVTLDRRHFGAIRPRHCDAFELLP